MSMWLEGDAYEFRKAVPRQWMRLGAAAKVLGTIKSPMPGKIIQVALLAAPHKLQGVDRGEERGGGRRGREKQGGEGEAKGGGVEEGGNTYKMVSRHHALQHLHESMMTQDDSTLTAGGSEPHRAD